MGTPDISVLRTGWIAVAIAAATFVWPAMGAAAACDKCKRHIKVNGTQASCLDRRLPQALKLTGDLVYVSLAECKGVPSGTRNDPPLLPVPKWKKTDADSPSGYWFVRGDAECLRVQLARRPPKAKQYEFDLSAC